MSAKAAGGGRKPPTKKPAVSDDRRAFFQYGTYSANSVGWQFDVFEQRLNLGPATLMSHYPLHHFFGQVRGEALHEVVHITPKESALAEAQAGNRRAEQFAGVQRHQVAVGFRVEGHAGDNAHTQP